MKWVYHPLLLCTQHAVHTINIVPHIAPSNVRANDAAMGFWWGVYNSPDIQYCYTGTFVCDVAGYYPGFKFYRVSKWYHQALHLWEHAPVKSVSRLDTRAVLINVQRGNGSVNGSATTIRVRQGCPLSETLFNIVLECVTHADVIQV